MKKIKFFMNPQKEQEWLKAQKGFRLVTTNGMRYIFEETDKEYNYEYIYFVKTKYELETIKRKIIDEDVEFVCNTSSWALFRKDASKGELCVYLDKFEQYKSLMKKADTYFGLTACYICLGSSQMVLMNTTSHLFGFSSTLFYLVSILFSINAYGFRKCAETLDDGTFKERYKKENKLK